jgi:hypothetical protein
LGFTKIDMEQREKWKWRRAREGSGAEGGEDFLSEVPMRTFVYTEGDEPLRRSLSR